MKKGTNKECDYFWANYCNEHMIAKVLYNLIREKLGLTQVCVLTLFVHKLMMISLFKELAILKNKDEISIFDRVEIMRNDDGEHVFFMVHDGMLNRLFIERVEVTRGFIKDENLFMASEGTSEAEALLLTSGKQDAIFSNYGVESIG